MSANISYPTVETTSPFLKVPEVASRLNLSAATVYNLIHAGELTAVRMGKSIRVHAKDLEQFISDNKTNHTMMPVAESDQKLIKRVPG